MNRYPPLVLFTLLVLGSPLRGEPPLAPAPPVIQVEVKVADEPVPAAPKKAGDKKAGDKPAAAKKEDKKPAAKKQVKAATAVVIEAAEVEEIRAEAAVIVGAAANPQEAMKQQFMQQYRPTLMAELSFIRQVCSLTPPQRPKIRAAGEASLEAAAKQAADQQQRQMRGVVVFNGGNETTNEPDKQIFEGLVKALHETLEPEQMNQFMDEHNKRRANRKRAAVLNLVARLDGALYLNSEQRTKIQEALSSHWKDRWSSWAAMQQYGEQYFPPLPDQYVTPSLSKSQKTVWNSLQKVEFGYWEGGGLVMNPEEDRWWQGEDADKKPKDKAKTKPKATAAPVEPPPRKVKE